MTPRASRRTIELFGAGDPLSCEALALVREIAGAEFDVVIRDILRDPDAQERAKFYRIRSIPAIVVDGLSIEGGCSGIDELGLRQLGIGRAVRVAETGRAVMSWE